MLLKLEIISTRINQVNRLWNDMQSFDNKNELVWSWKRYSYSLPRAGLAHPSLGLQLLWSQSFPSKLVAVQNLPYYLPRSGKRIVGFIPFQNVLDLCQMQKASFRIRTRVTVSISYVTPRASSYMIWKNAQPNFVFHTIFFFHKSFYVNVTIHPLAGPHYLNLLNYLWSSDRLVVSLISRQGYFTFLYKHTKHNIHNREGGRKENKQTRTRVSS